MEEVGRRGGAAAAAVAASCVYGGQLWVWGGQGAVSQPALLLPVMEHNEIDSCIEEWETLSNEYRALEVRRYEGLKYY